MKPITWTTEFRPINSIKPTPKNYKIHSDEGEARLTNSVKKYGLAGSIIINSDGTLINGNSRWKGEKKRGATKIKCDVPSRKLTPAEFKEFSALFDFARAGEVDLMEIRKDLGTTKSFFKEWGLVMPQETLDNLKNLDKQKITPRSAKEEIKKAKVELVTMPLTLQFDNKQNPEFIRMAESLYKKYNTDNVTDLVYKVFKSICKK